MFFGFLGSKETNELWMEGRGWEVPGNYGAVLALHWINLYPDGGEVWSSLITFRLCFDETLVGREPYGKSFVRDDYRSTPP